MAYFVAWPGLVAVSAFVLTRAFQFNRKVAGDAVGRLVLLMVVGSVMTWAALAAFATYDLSGRDQAAAIVLPLFLLWAGSMVLITWIVHRWGAEAVRLNLYHTEVAQMDRMKARLINTVAHEINTPLTPIRFRVSTMKAGGFGAVSPKQVEALQGIDRNLDRVDVVVGKMVLAVQLQTGKVQLFRKSVPLGPLVSAAVHEVSSAADEKGVAVEMDVAAAPTVEADAGRLAFAVEALLSNAVKFTPRGGRVSVRARRLGDDAAVEVHDTGAGLTAEAQVSLFQPLRQAHESMITESGAGLGLYAAEAILRLHGGRVTVASAGPGQGSTFRLLLPIKPA